MQDTITSKWFLYRYIYTNYIFAKFCAFWDSSPSHYNMKQLNPVFFNTAPSLYDTPIKKCCYWSSRNIFQCSDFYFQWLCSCWATWKNVQVTVLSSPFRTHVTGYTGVKFWAFCDTLSWTTKKYKLLKEEENNL